MPLTGHMLYPVTPKNTLTPLQKGLVLDCLIVILNCCGFCLLSIDTSLKDRWHESSCCSSAGILNSPTCRKLKTARQHAAAQIIHV